jgi:hypothetical protein
MPSQKAAVRITARTIKMRNRFLRTALMITPMEQRRKANSGQNKCELRPPSHWLAPSCIQEEAKAVNAVRVTATTPARANPLAQSGTAQVFAVSRQSSHVRPTTTPTIASTKSATSPPKRLRQARAALPISLEETEPPAPQVARLFRQTPLRHPLRLLLPRTASTNKSFRASDTTSRCALILENRARAKKALPFFRLPRLRVRRATVRLCKLPRGFCQARFRAVRFTL